MTDYPSEQELDKIRKWDWRDPDGLAQYICTLWYYPDYTKLTGKRIRKLWLATGGWSGNEDIVGALQQNSFWTFYWQKSVSGGAYWFKWGIKK